MFRYLLFHYKLQDLSGVFNYSMENWIAVKKYIRREIYILFNLPIISIGPYNAGKVLTVFNL